MIDSLLTKVLDVNPFAEYGRVTRVVGLVIEVVGVDLALGEVCKIESFSHDKSVLAEVVGFQPRGILLMPLGDVEGVHPGAGVQPLGRAFGVDVGPALLGRVLDGLGKPMDGRGPVSCSESVPLSAEPPNPLDRQPISEVLATGVRSIDGPLTIGKGQRIGIFSGSGVGKSTLLGMIARQAEADVNVIALLGERGREVRDFIESSLGPKGLAKSVLVVATGDQSALVRARGALVATSIAEYFRDQGKHVLLMVDSITRVAMAWREIGLAVGEPPTTRGYPPSVFAALPRLLERAGNSGIGGITGIYTVLVEGDDFNEPIADHARSILDGHVMLTRRLASGGHFPAVDVLQSGSRVRDGIVDAEELRAAEAIRRMISIYEEKADLISVGAYVPGSSPEIDAAIAAKPAIDHFLRQAPDERTAYADSRDWMLNLHQDVNRLQQGSHT